MRNYILPEYKNINYHQQYIEKLHGNNSLKKYNLYNLPEARLSYILLLEYIKKQNPLLLKNIKEPDFINFEDKLNLDYNTWLGEDKNLDAKKTITIIKQNKLNIDWLIISIGLSLSKRKAICFLTLLAVNFFLISFL